MMKFVWSDKQTGEKVLGFEPKYITTYKTNRFTHDC